MSAVEQAAEVAQAAVIDHANVVVAHDVVHPNRSDCGGVGGCLLMRTEHDGAAEVIEALSHLARLGRLTAVTAGIARAEASR